MRKTEIISKEAVVAEYLSTDITYRELEAKYGYPHASICHWVNGRNPGRKRVKKRRAIPKVLPEDVKFLQRELLKSQLHNKLLEEIIHQAEELTGFDLKKKFGTKQS